MDVTAKPVSNKKSITPTLILHVEVHAALAVDGVDVVAEHEPMTTSATPTASRQVQRPRFARGVDVAAETVRSASSATPTPPPCGDLALFPAELAANRNLGKSASSALASLAPPPGMLLGFLLPHLLLPSCRPPGDDALARALTQSAPLPLRAGSLAAAARRDRGDGGNSSVAPQDEIGRHTVISRSHDDSARVARVAAEDNAVVQDLGVPVQRPPLNGVRPTSHVTVRVLSDVPPSGH